MGCICEAHYYVSEGWLVREMKLFRNGKLASESRTRVYAVDALESFSTPIASQHALPA